MTCGAISSSLLVLLAGLPHGEAFSPMHPIRSIQPHQHRRQQQSIGSRLFATASSSRSTELPDSLQDAAERAAEATAAYYKAAGPLARCRVDFDTSVGDETYSLLKTSTEFMQCFVSATCYAMIPGLQERRQEEMMKAAQNRANEVAAIPDTDDGSEEVMVDVTPPVPKRSKGAKQSTPVSDYDGPVVRIYFPDEGNAALARRDWLGADPKVPACCQFSSCGGVQYQDISKDEIIFFFCPNAAESDSVEAILLEAEQTAPNLRLSVFVNPKLVDMGVTGFGLAGRRLRERLLDQLQTTYYLRTLAWGALTRQWPLAFSVWQEDESAAGGYRLIQAMDRLPSNPEVEDIYDIENGNMESRQGGGLLDQFGDFVNGMMRL
jgi:hypothetical protein